MDEVYELHDDSFPLISLLDFTFVVSYLESPSNDCELIQATFSSSYAITYIQHSGNLILLYGKKFLQGFDSIFHTS